MSCRCPKGGDAGVIGKADAFVAVAYCPHRLEILHAGRQIVPIFTIKPRFQHITLLLDVGCRQAGGHAQQQAGAGLAQGAAANMRRRGVDNPV